MSIHFFLFILAIFCFVLSLCSFSSSSLFDSLPVSSSASFHPTSSLLLLLLFFCLFPSSLLLHASVTAPCLLHVQVPQSLSRISLLLGTFGSMCIVTPPQWFVLLNWSHSPSHALFFSFPQFLDDIWLCPVSKKDHHLSLKWRSLCTRLLCTLTRMFQVRVCRIMDWRRTLILSSLILGQSSPKIGQFHFRILYNIVVSLPADYYLFFTNYNVKHHEMINYSKLTQRRKLLTGFGGARWYVDCKESKWNCPSGRLSQDERWQNQRKDGNPWCGIFEPGTSETMILSSRESWTYPSSLLVTVIQQAAFINDPQHRAISLNLQSCTNSVSGFIRSYCQGRRHNSLSDMSIKSYSIFFSTSSLLFVFLLLSYLFVFSIGWRSGLSFGEVLYASTLTFWFMTWTIKEYYLTNKWGNDKSGHTFLEQSENR